MFIQETKFERKSATNARIYLKRFYFLIIYFSNSINYNFKFS